VASRVVLIWGIVENFPVASSPIYSTMLLAWSVTEVVRYSYFALSLLGQVPAFLVWLRYNLFFVLYPLGIGSEAFLVYRSVGPALERSRWLGYLLVSILGIYVPGRFGGTRKKCGWFLITTPLPPPGAHFWLTCGSGAYVLYTHMMAQRRRVMRGKARARD
jgi:very-long-chain (3R)-3-hydroxyacyl-CoA dehydratase